jgi:hypothetical protein
MAEYIGRYRAERIVGSGAFGSVWLALDEALGAWVAIKILSETWAHDEEIRRRFMEEARILWRADSEHIVRIHNVDQLPDGRPYFVMDYADRGTLEQRMEHRAAYGQAWSVEETVDLGLAIADGLKVAHALGIVHRDLKPANVMFQSIPVHRGDTRAERLILTDFGIARTLAASRGHTISAGTPDYMAPEQVEGKADARSDVYAASALLYELLAGTVPHPHSSLRDVVVGATEGREAPLITTVRPDVPRELALVIHRGLALDVERRWPSAAAWAGALTGARAHTAAAAIPTELSGQQPQVAVPPAAAVPPAYAAAAPPPAAAQPPQQPPGGWPGQQPGQPVYGQPPQQPPGAPPGPGGPGGGGRKWWKVVVPIVAAIAIAGGGVGAWLALGGEEAEAATSLVLEPAASVGQDPFTESVVPDEEEEVELPAGADLPQEILDRLGGSIEDADPDAIAALIEELLAGLNPAAGGPTDFDLPELDLPPGGRVSGAAPGLYGGTQLLSVCDKRLLVDFLLANADKARAWAGVQGIPVGDIEAYVAGLTDVILQADTRVTNHGFSGGAATTIDTVLQAGTAVLVDPYGVPRVRCYCGNPLTPPRGIRGTPTYIGNPWPGFVIEQTIIIEQVTIIDEFSIDDLIADDFIFRNPGAPPEDATLTSSTEEPAQTITEPPATTEEPPATTEEPPATTEREPGTDITSAGNVNATSEFSSEFPASLAIDGDVTTSWFSAGSDSDGSTSTFAWGPGDQSNVFIESITVVSNADHANPDFRTGFGFSEVLIQVGGPDGIVYEETVSLDGTPDPNVTVEPGVVGNVVYLHFSGHEASNCGGFAELVVVGGPP